MCRWNFDSLFRLTKWRGEGRGRGREREREERGREGKGGGVKGGGRAD